MFLVFVCVRAKGCMQGTEWIEPDKCESILHTEHRLKPCMWRGCYRVCFGRPRVYGGFVCKGGLSQDSAGEARRDRLRG